MVRSNLSRGVRAIQAWSVRTTRLRSPGRRRPRPRALEELTAGATGDAVPGARRRAVGRQTTVGLVNDEQRSVLRWAKADRWRARRRGGAEGRSSLLGTRRTLPPATFQTPTTPAKQQSTIGDASRASANELIEVEACTASRRPDDRVRGKAQARAGSRSPSPSASSRAMDRLTLSRSGVAPGPPKRTPAHPTPSLTA